MPDFSDAEFKALIRENWRTYTDLFGADVDEEPWYRARPKINDGEPAAPYLAAAGLNSYKTLPDALYVRFCKTLYCDVIAIEACTSRSNFNDKRSRYGASTQSNILQVSASWLKTRRNVRRSQKMMFEYIGIQEDDLRLGHFSIPVRGLNVLYVLQDDHHYEVVNRYFPQHHEYFIPLGSLRGLSDKRTREFLQALDLKTHFFQ